MPLPFFLHPKTTGLSAFCLFVAEESDIGEENGRPKAVVITIAMIGVQRPSPV
jgi:hypothetical protein